MRHLLRSKPHNGLYKPLLTITVTLCLTSCGGHNDIDTNSRTTLSEKPFVVAVVGDGVPSPEPANRDHPINNAQGRAMWIGANTAFNRSPECASLRQYSDLTPIDDGGSVQAATKIALRLRSDPRTIAVIGHATSGTTRAAAWAYAETNIPLLMPIATSPYADDPPPSKRYLPSPLPNCFRLPPRDDTSQVAAIKYLLDRRLDSRRVYLMRDISEDAGEYSGPLFNKLEILLNPLIVAKRTIDRDSTNMSQLAASIRGYRTDTVVFVGYATTAQELLYALRLAYTTRDSRAPRPRIVMSDGCKTEEIDPSGFESYITFPLPDLTSDSSSSNSASTELRLLQSAAPANSKQSYEIYGYDAMLLLGRAFANCETTSSVRTCIIQQLHDSPDSMGVLFPYSFDENGENRQASYYVYASIPGRLSPGAFRLSFSISAMELKDELSRREPQ